MTTEELRDEQRRDCFILRDGFWFRFRVGAVILRDGCVLATRNARDPYYYSVGGAMKFGESAEQAVRREVLEETGVLMEPERLLFIHENFFPGADGLQCHEVCFYYLMKVPEKSVFTASSHSMQGDAEWVEWLPLDTYASVNAYPRFFATHLAPLPEQVVHIVDREEEGTTQMDALCAMTTAPGGRCL